MMGKIALSNLTTLEKCYSKPEEKNWSVHYAIKVTF